MGTPSLQSIKIPFPELKLQLQSSFENEESSQETEQPTEADSKPIVTPLAKDIEESCILSQNSEEGHTKCKNLHSDIISSHSSLAKELSELRLESMRYPKPFLSVALQTFKKCLMDTIMYHMHMYQTKTITKNVVT